MIAVCVILVGVLITFKSLNIGLTSFARYMIFYFSFNGILATGAIIREYLSLVYDKSKMKIKIIINVAALIIGVILTIFFQNDWVGLGAFLGGLAVCLYILTPTIRDNKQ